MPKAPVVVVANPAAGRGKAARILPKLRAAMAALGIEHRLEVSGAPDEPERLAREAAEDGTRLVVAMGGDGLVGMIANAVVGTGAALGVIPAGAGNDFARSLGLDHRRPLAAIAAFADPGFSRVDVARVETGDDARYFVNIAGAGFDSEVNEAANRMQTRLTGTARYLAAIAKTLRVFEPAEFVISVDGKERKLEAMMVAVGNGRSYGGGMRVCPGASLSDGALEVCVVGKMSRAEFLWAFPKVFRGTHVRHPKVTMLRGSRIEIRADKAALVYADGERVGPVPATFDVLPGALEVVGMKGREKP